MLDNYLKVRSFVREFIVKARQSHPGQCAFESLFFCSITNDSKISLLQPMNEVCKVVLAKA